MIFGIDVMRYFADQGTNHGCDVIHKWLILYFLELKRVILPYKYYRNLPHKHSSVCFKTIKLVSKILQKFSDPNDREISI